MNQEEKQLAASRPLSVAAELGASVLDAASVHAKRVVLTGEFPTLSTRNGQLCFLNSLRLLSRIVGTLDVGVPDGLKDLQLEVDALASSLWSQGTVRRVPVEENTFLGASAVLNVGSEVRPDLPWTSILANGWVARCTSGSRPLPAETRQENPLSCMLAASFGVTEVFKRIYAIPFDKAAPMEDAAFSLFELSCTFRDCGPTLPNAIALPETLILGAGAIGNGLVLLLSQLPVTGNVLIMDKQNFATENFGTCALLDSTDWIGDSKAKMLAEWLRARSVLNVEGESSTIEAALATPTFKNNIDLVINGLDDVGARRAVQKLWPSLLVDGAINSVGAAVVTHSISHRRFACMRCTFTEPNEDYIAQQIKATGLHKNSLEGDPNRLINDTDISAAHASARDWLRKQQRLGKTICSTISTGMAENLGLKLAKGFRPSVPFVATASAALVAAQLLRNLVWPQERFVHEFQFGSLFAGPSTATAVGRLAASECECTKNAGLIDMLIARRGHQMHGIRTSHADDCST